MNTSSTQVNTHSRHSPRKPSWKRIFLATLEQTGMVLMAAQAAGVDRSLPYKARAQDSQFAEQWTEAVDRAVTTLEDEAWRRARDGTTKPIYQRGGKVGEIQEYSDSLLMFLLRAHRPDKYRDRLISSSVVADLEVKHRHELSIPDAAKVIEILAECCPEEPKALPVRLE